MAIKGFSEKIADAMISGLAASAGHFDIMYQMGFNLLRTPLNGAEEEQGSSPLSGKLIVFTGAMQQGSRDEMKKQAKLLGAKVGDSVTGKTDMLICGEKVGESKLKKARALGIQLLSEAEYLTLVL